MDRDAFIEAATEDKREFNKDMSYVKYVGYALGTGCLLMGYFISIDAVIALLLFFGVMNVFSIERRLQHLQQQIDRISVHKA